MRRFVFATALLLASAHLALAQKNDVNKTEAQKTMDRNMENAKAVHDSQAKTRNDAQMRDTSHDGRIKVSDHTSVGGKVETNGASVNVKTDLDRPKK
jgi:hypothetical protein